MTTLPETALDELLRVAKQTRARSYAPYSKFRMGAAVLTENDIVIPGALVENVSLGLAMCAERTALFASVAQDAGRPLALALVAPRTGGRLTHPCGACLQVGAELGGEDLIIVVSDLKGNRTTTTLRELAPRLPLKS